MAVIKGHPAVVETLQFLAPSDLLRSSVVLGQLETGVINCAWPERNRLQLLALVDQLELVPVDRAVALACAQIRDTLVRQGTPIGANDLWIAAQAQALINWLR
ncbi:MAG: type II toxin-antitoxin system VapC family toxin [Cyanobium sp.]